MKKQLLTCLWLISFSATAYAQQNFRTTPASVIPFLEYLPQDYNKNSSKYPVVFFLHGIGERGPNSVDRAVLEAGVVTIKKHGPPKQIENGAQFPFILISLQLKNNFGSWPTWYVKEVIDHVKTYLRIDERKIHITGLSLGGGGTWTMAQEYPELFASVSAICGGYNAPSKACNLANEKLPVWAFHGDADDIVPLSTSATMVDAINKCQPGSNPLAALSVYPGVKHNAWDKAYSADHTFHKPNVYEWMMTHTNVVNRANKIPVANAGSDKTSTGSTYSFNGSGVDADGTIVSHAWQKIAGPACSLSNANTSTLNLSSLTTGTYMFRLTVTDNSGDTDSDYVRLIVHKAPTANAGSDITITLPATSVTLNGSGTDADGSIKSFNWSFVSGPKTPRFSAIDKSQVTASGLDAAGKYVFQLEVIDNQGGTATDQVIVTVSSGATTTSSPVANAGDDVTVSLPQNAVNITGKATDSDGSIVAYRWTFLSGPTVPSLTGISAQTLRISGLNKPGNYVFQLEVRDNSGLTATDEVIVSVLDSNGNAAPTVDAGSDVVIVQPVATVTLTAEGRDSDGSVASYSWMQISGPSDATIDNSSSSTVTVGGMTQPGLYIFSVVVTDNAGATAQDEVRITVSARQGMASSLRDRELSNEIDEADFGRFDTRYWDDKIVAIYGETGARIFQGTWSRQSYEAVFQKGGLIMYRITDGLNSVVTGKIFVQP